MCVGPLRPGFSMLALRVKLEDYIEPQRSNSTLMTKLSPYFYLRYIWHNDLETCTTMTSKEIITKFEVDATYDVFAVNTWCRHRDLDFWFLTSKSWHIERHLFNHSSTPPSLNDLHLSVLESRRPYQCSTVGLRYVVVLRKCYAWENLP